MILEKVRLVLFITSRLVASCKVSSPVTTAQELYDDLQIRTIVYLAPKWRV